MKSFLFVVLLSLVVLGPACGRKGASSAGAPATLEELNRAVSAVSMARAEFPPSTNDLMEFLKLEGKTMPVVPPGKKLYLDIDAQQYKWVAADSK